MKYATGFWPFLAACQPAIPAQSPPIGPYVKLVEGPPFGRKNQATVFPDDHVKVTTVCDDRTPSKAVWLPPVVGRYDRVLAPTKRFFATVNPQQIKEPCMHDAYVQINGVDTAGRSRSQTDCAGSDVDKTSRVFRAIINP